MDTFDFVIVGAGTAGCALAYRLAERGHRVCVLEAGPKDSNPYIRIPSGILKTSHNPDITWRYELDGSANTKGRKFPIFVGKTLGGSSAIHGMCYNRGQKSDFDNWAKVGNDGWDYASVLPYFRKSETYMSGGEDEFRGRDGPVPIANLATRDACSDAFIRGAVESGIPLTSDYNGREQMGVSYIQAQIHKGKRWSSAHVYLHPARRQFGVDVRTHSLVRRIVIENGRASGVEYSRAGSETVERVHARLGTIISAGAMASPKLLQLSGIGPARLLQDLGIPVILDLPGVGENLSDHYSVRMVARVHEGLGTINERAKGLPLLKEIAAWMLGKPSVLALGAMNVFAFCKSDPRASDTDYSLMFSPVSLKSGMTRQLDNYPGITGGVWQQRPESRGFVRARSTNINEAPTIQPNYLDAEIDRQVLVAAMKHLMSIFKSEAMKPIVREFTLPAHECRTDDEWLDYIRGNGMTSYHVAGTCKMGPRVDPAAVVDPRLRVHGLKGLHVVDASVMPTQPSGNTNAAVMMIAEKAASMILQEFPRQ